MPTPRPRPLPTMLLALLTLGCQSVQPLAVADIPRAPGTEESAVVVTTTAGDRVRLEGARVESDQLVGTNEGGRWAIPLDRVASVEQRRFHAGRTLTLAFALLAGAWVFNLLVLCGEC